jgi:anaphase-promoting complex subunit 8
MAAAAAAATPPQPAGTCHAQDASAVGMYVELSLAIQQLAARGLSQSVKWAAEQLAGLPPEAWEAGAAAAAAAAGAAAAAAPEHPKLVQGRCLLQLKVGVWACVCGRACACVVVRARCAAQRPAVVVTKGRDARCLRHAYPIASPPPFSQHTRTRAHSHTTRTQEYTRAAHVLSGLGGPTATFLRCYALFLAGEKQKQ